MNWKWIQQTNWRLSPLQFAIVVLLILGVWFRFANLDQKVCWDDEIISSFRMASYTQEEVERQLFNGEIHSPASFQQLPPDRTLSDTLHSLVVEAHALLTFALSLCFNRRRVIATGARYENQTIFNHTHELLEFSPISTLLSQLFGKMRSGLMSNKN
ncbi:MAG: hypothetical protein GDA56_29720 [Hormoscilla sp. GM7CHS1pb]|nr:hypothetical protein [Hormoscilla sp. GM7CHS1pb]